MHERAHGEHHVNTPRVTSFNQVLVNRVICPSGVWPYEIQAIYIYQSTVRPQEVSKLTENCDIQDREDSTQTP